MPTIFLGILIAIVVALARVVFRRAQENPRASHRCPCCGYKTLPNPFSHEICQVCFWQDDGQDDKDADEVLSGPNYELSLTQAWRNFEQLGAVSAAHIKHVRPPRPEEL